MISRFSQKPIDFGTINEDGISASATMQPDNIYLPGDNVVKPESLRADAENLGRLFERQECHCLRLFGFGPKLFGWPSQFLRNSQGQVYPWPDMPIQYPIQVIFPNVHPAAQFVLGQTHLGQDFFYVNDHINLVLLFPISVIRRTIPSTWLHLFLRIMVLKFKAHVA